jgi:DNA-directed RNA polymerase subunit L
MSKSKSKSDIQVELHDYIPHGKFQRGRMRLLFSGKDANTQFINSIGRVMMDRIPTYAYARELIKVERIDPESGYRDSVAINHDMITIGLKNIPVQNVDPGIHYLHERYWKGVDFLDDTRETHEVEQRIELNVDVRNTADEMDIEALLPVTTNDMQIYVEDEETKLYDPDFPFILLRLKPREQIRLSARAVLGVGLRDACWQAASNYAIDDETFEDEGSVILMFKAVQINEYVLMERALEYFKERVDLISNMMEKMYLTEEEKTGTFIAVIEGEDYTIGTPLAYEFQSHPDALMASCGMPDNLVDQVNLEIVTDDPDSIVKIIQESTANLLEKIETVKEQFKRIRESTYSKYLDADGKSKFYDFNEVREEDPVKSGSKSKATVSTKTAKATKATKTATKKGTKGKSKVKAKSKKSK